MLLLILGLTLVLLLVLLLAYAVAAATVLPAWIVSLNEDPKTHPGDIVTTRGALLGALGPLVVAIGALAAYLNYRVAVASLEETTVQNRRLAAQADKTLDLAERGQITERFTKAIDQLGDVDRLDIRLGGIYALEQVAKGSKELHGPVMEILTAYLRNRTRGSAVVTTHATEREVQTSGADVTSSSDGRPFLRADFQAIITVLGRREVLHDPPGYAIDLHDATLDRAVFRGPFESGARFQGADFTGAQLQDVDFEHAQLQRAKFTGAKMKGSTLAGAELLEASFQNAQLETARFNNAMLHSANFGFAHLIGAQFYEAGLVKATFAKAKLQGANFGRADLTNAVFRVAELQGAGFLGAQLDKADFVGAQLAKASFDGAKMQGASFVGARASGTDFSDATLNDASFLDAQLRFAHFDGAQLDKADFSGADLEDAKFALPGAEARNAQGLTLPQLSRAKGWRKAVLPKYLGDVTEGPA